MFSSNPAKSLGEKAVGGKGVEMTDKANNLANEAKSQAEMANKAKNLASDMKSQADKANKVATEMKSQAEMTDKAKNLAGEFGSQGLSSTGGVGLGSAGMGNTGGIGASAAGIGGQSMNALRSGTGNADSSNARAFNRDGSHSGYGGHNTNTDSYGRDTTHSETYGRGNTQTGMNEGYSMSSDRERLREQGNTGTGTTFGTSDLARGTGTGPHHHATSNELGTSSTRTGIHSGDGIHSEQYHGRTNDTVTGDRSTTYTSGGSTGIGHHPHAAGHHGNGVGHHQVGEGIHARQYTGRSGGVDTSETVSGMRTGSGYHDHHHHTGEGHHNLENECEFCHKYSASQRDTMATGTAVPTSYSEQDKNKNLKSTSTGVPSSSAQERNVKTTTTSSNVPANQSNLPAYGETIMTTTTSTNTTEGPSPYHLRPGETIVEKETRVHRGVSASTGTTHRTTVTGASQPTSGQMNTGGMQPQQRRKASVGEKLMDKMSGKAHPNVDTVEDTARTVNPSRN